MRFSFRQTSVSPSNLDLAMSDRVRVRSLILCSSLALIGGLVRATALPPQQPARQAPVKEEEEEPGKGKRKAAPKVGDEDFEPQEVRPKGKGLTVLAEEAERSRAPQTRQLFTSLVIPFDRVFLTNGRDNEVEPVARFIGSSPDFPDKQVFRRLRRGGQTGISEITLSKSEVARVEHFEQIALDKVEKFLKDHLPRKITDRGQALLRQEVLQDAATVLKEVLTFHKSARQTGVRNQDGGWGELEERLKQKLLDIQLEQMHTSSAAKDWPGAMDKARQIVELYPERREIQAQLARQLAHLAEQPISERDYFTAAQRLERLEQHFPNHSSEFDGLRRKLEDRANELLREARELARSGKDAEEARKRIREARSIWRRVDTTELQSKLGESQVLYVGVQDLPQQLSPARALTDVEKLALDLLFEGLLQLSDERPQMTPLGRVFALDRKAYWSDGERLTASDVVRTVDLLKDESWVGRDHGWGDLVANARQTRDAFHVHLTLSQGYLTPLELMHFKILPRNLNRADNPNFAARPVGSGPYRYLGQAGKYAVFQANPNYGNRDNRLNLPRIREIRFYVPEKPFEDFKDDQLHLYLGLSRTQAMELRSQLENASVPKFRVLDTSARPLQYRRVYFLAVNHRHPQLRKLEIRKALSFAIDRLTILETTFGVPRTAQRSLTGPYLPGSWASDPNMEKQVLFRPGLAKGQAEAAARLSSGSRTFRLKFPGGDPAVQAACVEIARQVETHTNGLLKIVPEERSARQLREDVEQRHDYELAYYCHDYASEAYWLWPLFDPRGAKEPGGTNYLGYVNDSQLESHFQELLSHRDFQEVQRQAHAIHRAVFDRLPLIPLWHLDAYFAVHHALRIPPDLDPLRVFADAAYWELTPTR